MKIITKEWGGGGRGRYIGGDSREMEGKRQSRADIEKETEGNRQERREIRRGEKEGDRKGEREGKRSRRRRNRGVREGGREKKERGQLWSSFL